MCDTHPSVMLQHPVLLLIRQVVSDGPRQLAVAPLRTHIFCNHPGDNEDADDLVPGEPTLSWHHGYHPLEGLDGVLPVHPQDQANQVKGGLVLPLKALSKVPHGDHRLAGGQRSQPLAGAVQGEVVPRNVRRLLPQPVGHLVWLEGRKQLSKKTNVPNLVLRNHGL